MKYPSEIASSLRAQGRKFSQTKLIAALEANCTPVLTHGRTVIYEDSAVDTMLGVFPKRAPKPIVTQEAEYRDIQEDARLINIENLLKRLCLEFNISLQ